jgi:hypothetical protein
VSSALAVSHELVTHDRAGRERVHPYVGEDALVPGSVVLLGGPLLAGVLQAAAFRRVRKPLLLLRSAELLRVSPPCGGACSRRRYHQSDSKHPGSSG